MTWVKIGDVGVDAGVVWIGDPCYVITEDAQHAPKTWLEFCDKGRELGLFEKGFAEICGPGMGLEIATLYGDGIYPVYAEHTTAWGGQQKIGRVMIDFNPGSDEDEE